MKNVYILMLGLFLGISFCVCSVNSSYAVSNAVLEEDGYYNLDPDHKMPFKIRCMFVCDRWGYKYIVVSCAKRDALDSQNYRVFLEYTHVNGDVEKVTCDVKEKIFYKSAWIDLNSEDDDEAHPQSDNLKRLDFSWAIL